MIINKNYSVFKTKQAKPVFKSLSRDYFHPIKNHPKMVCGCCGKKTLSIIKYMKTISSIALPLQVQLEKGALDYLAKIFPKAWDTIQNLSEKNPEKTLDEILHYENIGVNENYIELKKAVIQDIENDEKSKDFDLAKKNRYIDKTFFDLNDFGRSYMKQSSIVINHLEPLVPYLEGVVKDVFEQLKIYSIKYPKSTLSEIVKKPEVEQFHREQYLLQKAEKQAQIELHFDNILKLVEKNNPELISDFQNLQEQAIKMLHVVKSSDKRKYLLEKMYSEALKKYSSNINKEDVMNEIKQLPETFISKDNFFVYVADKNFTDVEIINSMFGNILSSEKYIIPIEQGGSEKLGNKIVMCRGCNTRTKTEPYKEIIKYRTEMPINMQKQINIITGEILQGGLNPRLRAYPTYVANNFKTASENTINLDIIDYCEETIKRSKKKVENNKTAILQLKKKQKFEATQKSFLNEKEILLQEKIQKFLDENK